MEVQSPSPLKERPEPAFVSGTPIPGDPGTVITHGCFHPDHEEVIRFFEKNLVYAVQSNPAFPVKEAAGTVMHQPTIPSLQNFLRPAFTVSFTR
jgi:hypothetical protein